MLAIFRSSFADTFRQTPQTAFTESRSEILEGERDTGFSRRYFSLLGDEGLDTLLADNFTLLFRNWVWKWNNLNKLPYTLFLLFYFIQYISIYLFILYSIIFYYFYLYSIFILFLLLLQYIYFYYFYLYSIFILFLLLLQYIYFYYFYLYSIFILFLLLLQYIYSYYFYLYSIYLYIYLYYTV